MLAMEFVVELLLLEEDGQDGQADKLDMERVVRLSWCHLLTQI